MPINVAEWGMRKRSSKQGPEDLNTLARSIVDAATEDEPTDPTGEPVAEPAKDPAAVALGRKGGLKGGRARADAMTAKQRSAAAKKAAKARWGSA